MSFLSQFLGGGGVPIGGVVQFGQGMPTFYTFRGQEYLKQTTLISYAAKYSPLVSLGLGVWGNAATHASSATGGASSRCHYVGTNYVVFSSGVQPKYAASLAGAWTDTGAASPAPSRRASFSNGTFLVYAHNSANQAPLYSSNGSAFSPVGGTFTTFPVPGVVAFGNNIWVSLSSLNGVAGEQGYLAAANPSGAWTVGASTAMNMTAVNGVAYGNGVFVAGGQSATATGGKLATCTTPAGGWTDRTAASGITFAASDQIYDVVFNGSYFFALATGGRLLRSADGITWTVISNLPIGLAAGTLLEAIAGRIVVLQQAANSADIFFASSADSGASWSIGKLYAGKIAVQGTQYVALNFANSKWVINHSGTYLNPGDYGALDMTAPNYIGYNYANIGQVVTSGSISVPAHNRIL